MMHGLNGDYVTIAEACKRLNIAPNTLRSWGAAGKIQEYRHPMNNYRLYNVSDIEKLAKLLHTPIKVGAAKVARRSRLAN